MGQISDVNQILTSTDRAGELRVSIVDVFARLEVRK